MSSDPSDADLFPAYDPFQHLDAIHSMLRNLSNWVGEYERDVADAGKSAAACSADDHMAQAFAQCNYVDACSANVFANAAFSNTVVGALAPLFEGVFNHEFRALKHMTAVLPRDPALHRRCKLADDQFWNPYLYVDRKGNVADERNIQHGAKQILTGLGLLGRFPSKLSDMTLALFRFRNRALHLGLEWLTEDRTSFAKAVEGNPDWKRWFCFATTDGVPWVIGVTPEFMEECFDLAVQTVHVFERIRFETQMKLPSELVVPEGVPDVPARTEMLADLEAFVVGLRRYTPIRTESHPDISKP